MKGKTKVHYFEKDGKYYKQEAIWWEKHGYYIPQTPRRISKEVYEANKEKGDSERRGTEKAINESEDEK